MTPFSICHEIARRNGSPLFMVSRLLGQKKQRLFTTAYAAMRVVDDLVDETFFSGDMGQRQQSRHQVLQQIDRWCQQALAASQGCFLADAEAFEPMIFTGLNATIGVSDLGPWPWNALAAAMKHDVNEQEIVSWEDFLNYCEGATVAPAATFAYILACEIQHDRYVLEQDPDYCQNHVREMAIFCYLIHIIRDLAKDVKKHAQLITIPRTLLEAAGLQRASLALQLDHQDSMEILIRSLLTQAEQLLQSGQPNIQQIPLKKLEKMILHRLLDKYIHLYQQLKAQPTRFLSPPH